MKLSRLEAGGCKAGSTVRLLLIDTSMPGSKGSMSRYARLVERALRELPELPVRLEINTLCLALPLQVQGWLPGSFRTWVNHVWIILSSNFRIRRTSTDIIHVLDGSYAYIVNGIDDRPVTATVHDLIPLLQQQELVVSVRPSFPARWIINRSLEGLIRCRHLVAVSRGTSIDLQRLLGVDSKNITVAQNPLDPTLVAMADKQGTDSPSASEKLCPIILHVGHNAHYKNREGVLRIFSMVNAETRARLVMAGPPPTERMLEMTASLELQDSVEFVQPADDKALSLLYNRASLFLFPSLYEGFGWPPLEAMAFGCPVVCSSAASLPEVAGDVALMDAPENEAGLAQKCLAVLNDPELARSMSERGRVWSRNFSLERMGAQLLDVYRQVLDHGGGYLV